MILAVATQLAGAGFVVEHLPWNVVGSGDEKIVRQSREFEVRGAQPHRNVCVVQQNQVRTTFFRIFCMKSNRMFFGLPPPPFDGESGAMLEFLSTATYGKKGITKDARVQGCN